ncbi:MAG: hypothetical protein KBT29_07720 [Prevotellaceae bacterium]|nr:hypothetical protein [Candidatus Minthosoma caballi]
MKKFLLSLVVALSAVAANAQTKLTIVPPNQWWGSKDVTIATAGKISYDSQYGEFNIKKNLDLSVYTGMTVVYKDMVDTQIKIQGDAEDPSTYSKKAEVYIGLDGAEGEKTIEFPASLGTKIEALSLQGLAPGGQIAFDKIILLKGEEQEIVSDFAGMAWGGTFTKVAGDGVDILITDGYGEIGFKEAVSYEAGKEYKYDVTFGEATPEALQFKICTEEGVEGAQLGSDSKYYIYQDVPAGATSASVTVDYVYSSITLQCAVANTTFKGIQATLTVGNATSVASAAAAAAVPVAYYNSKGQKISKLEKGVNIVKMSDDTVKKIKK